MKGQRQPMHHTHQGNRMESWAMALVVLFCGWLYFWNANPAPAAWLTRPPADFYGYQTAGFLAGQLSTSNAPHPALLALSNPYDPVANAPYRVHDMTLWQGKYYLYFGTTPIVLFFGPIKALTGWHPTEPLAVVTFLTLGLAAGGVFLAGIRRIYFPGAPRWVSVLGLMVLGLANPVVQLTTRAQVYQVPIACAYCLHLLALASSLRAMQSRRRAHHWLAVTGVFVGLALGARPNTLVATPWLLVPLAVCVGWDSGRRFTKSFLVAIAATFGPVALAGMVVLLLNWLRFGSVSEFGATYQLAGSNQLALALFSPGRIFANAPEYLFSAGSWQPYFPFLALPEGRPWGVLLYLPWIWMAFWAARPGWCPPALTRLLGIYALANFLLIACYFATVERYLSDFTPALLLLGTVGATAFTASPGTARRAAAALLGLATVISGGLIFAQRAADQEKIRPLARAFNQIAGIWDKVAQREHGALRLDIELPATVTAGLSEPLVETGRQTDQRDWLQLTYQSDGSLGFEFFHAGFGLVEGSRIPVPADRKLVVEIRCGGLLPPLAHPMFAGWNDDDYRRERDQLWVIVNGTEVLRTTLVCYESGPRDILIGRHRDGGVAAGARFSGRILNSERLPFARAAEPRPAAPPAFGVPLELRLTFPTGRAQGAEPILATGTGSKSDLLYYEFVGTNMVRFGLDHFGYGGRTSKSVTIDPLALHQLQIWTGAMADENTPDAWRRRLVVKLNGETIIDGEQEFFQSLPNSAAIGLNPHGASTASRQFTGRLLGVRSLLFEQL